MTTIESTTCYTISGPESFEQGLEFCLNGQNSRRKGHSFSREREPNYQTMEKPNVLKFRFCFEQNNLLYKNGHSKKK